MKKAYLLPLTLLIFSGAVCVDGETVVGSETAELGRVFVSHGHAFMALSSV